jgi:hypothetical protein
MYSTMAHAQRHQIACCFNMLTSFFLNKYTLIMACRGPELSPQMRARICELRSLGWSYNCICAKHLNIPKLTIGDMCCQEAKCLNNASQPRLGTLRVIIEE